MVAVGDIGVATSVGGQTTANWSFGAMHRTGFIAAPFSDALSCVRGMACADGFSAWGVIIRSIAVCGVILCGVGVGYAQSALPTSTAAGVFTEEQAKRGG